MTETLPTLLDALSDLSSGRLTASALLEQAIANHRPDLDAYRDFAPQSARRGASRADERIATLRKSAPHRLRLTGVPISVKDLYGVTGFKTYAGTQHELPAPWNRSGPFVRWLEEAGAVILGKTHSVEFAFGGLGSNPHWPTPRNPWDAEHHRVPGGSSSGAGVSLVEGSAMLALGTDTAGSVRIPASFTGQVGLKTTAGRWPTGGVVPLSSTLDTVGFLARTVEDAALAFTLLDPETRHALAPARAVPRSELGDWRFARVDHLWEDCDAGIPEILDQALAELAKAGAPIAGLELSRELEEIFALLATGHVASAELDEFLESELPAFRARLDETIAMRIRDGGDIPAREYLRRRRQLAKIARRAEDWFEAADFLLAPTVILAPPRLDEIATLEAYRRQNARSLRNTSVASLAGLCALSIPVGLDHRGLPIGLQVVARGGEELRLLSCGLAIERRLGSSHERLGRAPLA